MRKIVLFIATAFIGLSFSGCTKPPVENGNDMEQSHTLVMYLIGSDNSMQSSLSDNITKTLAAVDNTFPSNGKIFVYFNRLNSNTLYEVVPPKKADSPAELISIKTYDQSVASTTGERMKEVVADIKALSKTDTYGFVMGTHGTGWFPKYSFTYPTGVGQVAGDIEHEFDWENSMTRSFGPDNGVYGSSDDLVGALYGQGFEYVVFDMCFMSSVEFLYDLRGIAPYIVASPVEIMIAGMPYKKMIPVLFSKDKKLDTKSRLIKISDIFVTAYESGEIYLQEEYRSAAITVINTAGLDALASSVKNIFADGTKAFDIAAVQGLENLSNHAFFDLKDYMHSISGNTALLAAFDSALSNMILFEKHTAHIYSGMGSRGTFDTKNFCGVSSYIPREQFSVARQAYYNTAWGKFTQPGMGS